MLEKKYMCIVFPPRSIISSAHLLILLLLFVVVGLSRLSRIVRLVSGLSYPSCVCPRILSYAFSSSFFLPSLFLSCVHYLPNCSVLAHISSPLFPHSLSLSRLSVAHRNECPSSPFSSFSTQQQCWRSSGKTKEGA